MTQAKCIHCGKTYEAERKTSRYCSAKCRVAYNRAEYPEGTMDREYTAVRDSLEVIANLPDSDLNTKRNKEMLARIFAQIDQIKARVQ